MRLFISAGEPSGDLHAANLVKALKTRLPRAEFVGFGGPHLEKTGTRLLYPLVELAVMWFGRVLINLHKFVSLAFQADRYFRDEMPDAVILIDYPGFHWALAKRAKRRGIPVIYYVPPQIWAWAGWRVKKMKKYVDHVLCSLPFEVSWYRERGVAHASYVGHPYFDELKDRQLDLGFVAEQKAKPGPVIAILPGSRTQELMKNLPTMLRAAAIVLEHRSDARFVVACLHERHRELALEIWQDSELRFESLQVFAGRTPELIRLADAAWAVSGSVGLELMVEALPTVVLYKVMPYELTIARPFIKAKYISLVNLLADAEVMPEYLTDRDVSADLASWGLMWIEDPAARAEASAKLAQLCDRVARPGASDRAADHIVEIITVEAEENPIKGPHKGPVRSRTRNPQALD
jgi:lipid-A-disaccharide synthase